MTSSSRARMGYVDIDCAVDRDAYVLVIGIDLDRKAHVLYPESPDGSAFIAREHSVSLQRFRGGAGNSGDGQFPTQGVHDPTVLTEQRANNGVILVVVSDAPLQLEALHDDSGYWNTGKMELLVLNGSAASGAMTVGRMVTGPNQLFSVDSRVNVFR
jgi:hypothetical protein